MRDELKTIFSNVNEWLKFAEAKNAGITAFNAAIIIGLSSAFPDIQNYINKYAFLGGIFILGISILLAFNSQFPQLDNEELASSKIEKPNLYFFGNLSKLTTTDFVLELQKRESGFVASQFDLDIINQIIINSKIAVFKYNNFKNALITSIVGISIIVISILIKTLCP